MRPKDATNLRIYIDKVDIDRIDEDGTTYMQKSIIDHMQKLVKKHKQRVKELEDNLKKEQVKGKNQKILNTNENIVKSNYYKGEFFFRKDQSLIAHLLSIFDNTYDVFTWFLIIRKEMKDRKKDSNCKINLGRKWEICYTSMQQINVYDKFFFFYK